MRAALYLRVSTARQAEKDLSIPDQHRQGEAYCQAKGWTVARAFEERGASATDDKRPVFQEMVEAASRPDRDFEVIVVHSYSRFFRDAYQLEFYLRRFQKFGVSVVSITQETGDDPTSQLIRKIVALFDEYSSKENGKHTLRAMKENARQGFWNGSRPPYGYRTVDAERRGDKAKKRLVIDDAEAAIVRMIYDLHLHGTGTGQLGVKAIADHLNRKGLRFRGGRQFSTGLVHRLLTRETYVGRHWFNQIEARTQTEKPRDEWIEFRLPPIITEETFAQARASLEERSPKKIAPRLVTSPVLLTGLACCATCGGGMQLRTGKSGRYRYYTCSTCARQGKTVCKGRSVPMDTLDGLVLDHLARRLFTPERLAVLLAQHAETAKSGAEEWAQRAKAADKDLREIETRARRLYELVELGLTPLDDGLKNRLAELNQQREEAIHLKSVAERQKGLHRQILAPERMAEFCAAMQRQLRAADIAVRKAYLRLFVERIEVDDAEIRMFGHKGSLEAGIRRGTDALDGSVPSFVREWPLRDSNPC